MIFLAIATAATTADGQAHTAIAQIVLMLPLLLLTLPAGVLADRMSKRSILVAAKLLELALMLAGTAVPIVPPGGGPLALVILGLLGVQAALFGPSQFGIIPELVPHERLSQANGLLEMGSSMAILVGMVAGAASLPAASTSPCEVWPGTSLLAVVSRPGVDGRTDDPACARGEGGGGLGATVRTRLGGDPRRSRPAADDHRPDPGLEHRQPGAGADHPVRLEDPGPDEGWRSCRWSRWALGIAGGCLLAGRLSGERSSTASCRWARWA